MGLFDKRDKRKQSDDFDSPVEQIDLDAPPEPDPTPEEAEASDAEKAEEPAAAASREAEEPEEEPPPPLAYGIQQAIELMRTLPSENVELVVRVVKHTLESTRIKIPTIIDDATRKQESIQGRIKVLKDEIGELEKEIATRRKEIGELEADFAETSTVKERLVLAERLTKKEAEEAAAGAQAQSPASRPRSGTKPPAAGRPRSPTGSPPSRSRSPSEAPPTAKTAATATASGSVSEKTSAAGKK